MSEGKVQAVATYQEVPKCSVAWLVWRIFEAKPEDTPGQESGFQASYRSLPGVAFRRISLRSGYHVLIHQVAGYESVRCAIIMVVVACKAGAILADRPASTAC